METNELRVYTSSMGGYAAVVATIGKNIRRLRIDAGFKNQGEFADALKLPQSRVSDWETGRYEYPDAGNLMLIAKILKVSVDALLEGVDPAYDQIIQRGGAFDVDAGLSGARAEQLRSESKAFIRRFRRLTDTGRAAISSVLIAIEEASASASESQKQRRTAKS